ncbi:MAG: GNAT family N-acetyltransferase [Hyphomicrobiaceae bacterium]|nr:GNAT family N-acetyltransferase [Hyphomicrobiaceae bacterium]
MMRADRTPADTSSALRICGCEPHHAGELAQLHASLFEAPWDAANFKELLANPGTLAFAARSSAIGADKALLPWGLIVGRVAADEAEVLTLAVAREHQRLGVGARLVERLCRAVQKCGAHRLYLEVAEANKPARALYAGLGFQESGRRRGYYVRAGASREDAINMCLKLNGPAEAGTRLERRGLELDGLPAKRPRR